MFEACGSAAKDLLRLVILDVFMRNNASPECNPRSDHSRLLTCLLYVAVSKGQGLANGSIKSGLAKPRWGSDAFQILKSYE